MLLTFADPPVFLFKGQKLKLFLITSYKRVGWVGFFRGFPGFPQHEL